MLEKFSQSWSLVKASASVLKSDKELLVFPLLSALSCIIVAATFFVPAIFAGVFSGLDRENMNPLYYLFLFAFYVVQYFVIIFFNSALIGAAMIRLNGGDPTVADGMRIAMSKLPAILGYAVIAATVGVILRALQERAGFIGRFVVGLIGLAWTVASFLVVPVLVSQDIGPIDAVKRSAELLKKTWGQNLIGTGGIGLVFGLMFFALVIVGGGLIVLAVKSGILAITITAVVAVVVAVLLLTLIQAALQGVYAAALYRYATEGDAGVGFDKAMVAEAFKVKA
ncbi:MAG: DUF6159 family protein [Dokdonella sp.]|uniref:DUF6159 family protein n=1 Tax=Dokdonella sp. TaxID=2291710 RepID=UPI002BE28049|nr:DUF6159 family protein [Dokdonella sp.]HOX72030.1 DUF6159 family protein [Dokdonella sp.]HPG94591.1 DUF6159 family protein [Dokdonella sp.]HPN79785.1 DUF6159 family protein [Dokdonella sp.]